MNNRRQPVVIDQESGAPRGSGQALSGVSAASGEVPPPVPAPGAPLSEYKGFSLKNIGRDPKTGKNIPYKYSSRVAKQITVWIAAGGADLNAICVRLNMRPGTLKALYGKEIALAVDQVNMDVGAHILSRVKKSDRLAVFYAKAKMGWRDGDAKPTDTGVLNIVIHT